MTREEIVSIVLMHTNREDRQDLMFAAIDLALTEISQVHRFISMREDFVATLQAGETSINLPPNTIGIWECRSTIPDDPDTEDEDESDTADVTPVALVSKHRALRLSPSSDRNSEGRPSFGYIDNGVLKITPPADQTYSLEMTVYRSYPAMSSGESTPSVNLDSAIVAWVTSYVFRSIQDLPSATTWMQEYARALSLAVKADNSKMYIEGRAMEGFSPGVAGYQSMTPWLDPFAERN